MSAETARAVWIVVAEVEALAATGLTNGRAVDGRHVDPEGALRVGLGAGLDDVSVSVLFRASALNAVAVGIGSSAIAAGAIGTAGPRGVRALGVRIGARSDRCTGPITLTGLGIEAGLALSIAGGIATDAVAARTVAARAIAVGRAGSTDPHRAAASTTPASVTKAALAVAIDQASLGILTWRAVAAPTVDIRLVAVLEVVGASLAHAEMLLTGLASLAVRGAVALDALARTIADLATVFGTGRVLGGLRDAAQTIVAGSLLTGRVLPWALGRRAAGQAPAPA